MSALDFLLPWDSQPQETVDVDRDNPLASGLLIAILPQFPVNLADGVALSAYGTRVVSGGVRGMMNTSGGMLLPAPVNASDPSAKYDLSSGTALVVAVQSTETNTGVVFTRGRGSAEPLWAIGLHGGSFDGAYGSWGNSGHLGASSGGPVPTIPRTVAITADGATARVYIDGADVASGAYTPGTPDYDTANLRRVLFGLNKLGVNTNTNTFLALLWNRPLSAAEVKEVSGNPWQLFAPRSIWVPVSAGGGGTTVAGSLGTAAASGITGSVDANRTIAGSVGVASALGIQGGVSQSSDTTVTGTVGVATASGIAGGVDANRTIAGALGVATASGLTGTVSNTNDTVVTGSVGTATASGVAGTVAWNRTLAGIVGEAIASGIAGGVQSGDAVIRRHAGYKREQTRKGYIIKGERYWLTEDELMAMVAAELSDISRKEVQQITQGKPKPISKKVWDLIQPMERIVALTPIEAQDDDEDDIVMMFV